MKKQYIEPQCTFEKYYIGTLCEISVPVIDGNVDESDKAKGSTFDDEGVWDSEW